MMRFAMKPFRRFAREEDGNSTIEFSLLFIPMFTMLLWSVELGMIHVNYSMLERAVDSTVRDLRLGTGTVPTHDQIRDAICERAAFVTDCDSDVRLEMVRIDPFNWANPPTTADCVDSTQPIHPVRSFINGASNELMYLRVCAKFDPILSHIGMADRIQLDGDGQYKLVTASAFVQEPR